MKVTIIPRMFWSWLAILIAAAAIVAVAALRTGATSLVPTAAQLTYNQKTLTPDDPADADNFGYAVAIDGNTLVVGAYLADSGGQDNSGAAYVFTRPANGSSQWTQVKQLTASDGAASDQFGSAVAVDGDIVAISATHADVNGNTNQGAVYLYGRNQGGPNNWGEVKKIWAAEGNGLDEFGNALVVEGDEVLVASQAADANGYIRNGAVFVFRRDEGGPNNWGEADILFDPEGRDSDNFGSDLALDGDWLVVGADRADVTGSFENDGAALLFNRAVSGANWTFVKRLIASDAKGSEQFGGAVAISDDTVLVGAPAAGHNGQLSAGKAYLFGRDTGGAGKWGEIKILTASNGQGFDNFSGSVALDGDKAYVAATKGDMTLVDEGAVYIYQRDEGGANNWGEALKLGADGGAPNANFGKDMALSGDSLLVGANLADSAKGKAYIFSAATPPEITLIHLPAVFDLTFSATGTLINGGVVTGPDDVKLGAVAGALESPLPVSIGEAIPPAIDVPDRAKVIGDYYRVAAERDAVQPLDRSFILALPVPDGADTDNLAAAVFGSTASLLDMDNHTGQYWRFVPGVYDEAKRRLLLQFPFVSSSGEIVVLVEHPDMPSPRQSSTRAAGEANSVTFNTACTTSLVCNDALLKEFKDELQKQYNAFDFYGYGLPRMVGSNSNVSIDPPQLGSPNQVFFAFLFSDTQAGCIDTGGKTAYAGIYAPDTASLFICVANGDSSLSDFKKDTVRHEYFHALEFSYDNVLMDWAAGDSENWIIEGMAEVVINSGWDWARSGSNNVRPVDRSLRDDDDLLSYRAEDFWAFYGRNRASGAGIERLQPILLSGATFLDVFSHTGFAEDYWLWVRNQVIEKSDDLDGALVDGKCKLEESAVSRLYTVEAGVPSNNPLIGTVDPLGAYVVEVVFPDDWVGRETMIIAGALPMDKPAPTGFEYKIYRTPWPNCSSTPDNMNQRYKITPGERYFVVFANWVDQKVLPWYVAWE